MPSSGDPAWRRDEDGNGRTVSCQRVAQNRTSLARAKKSAAEVASEKLRHQVGRLEGGLPWSKAALQTMAKASRSWK